ncbi:MAG: AI-2E family transporter [Actinomycetia bacterium]|nr:AI-2E family transporter [Actinomycetes bacterium]
MAHDGALDPLGRAVGAPRDAVLESTAATDRLTMPPKGVRTVRQPFAERPGAPRALRIAYVAAAALAGAGLLWVSWGVLMPFVFAGVLAYLLAPVVAWFESHGLNRVAGVLLAYALTAIGVAALVLYLLPMAVQQSLNLAHVLPGFVTLAQTTWDRLLATFHEAPIPPAIRQALNQFAVNAERRLVGEIREAVGAVFGLVPGLIAVAVSPILAFYLLKDLPQITRQFWALVPLDWHPAAFKLGRDLDRTLAGFIRGQLLVALLVGSLSTILTMLLGLPYALLIGMVAGLTDIIPYVGPIAGALPAVLLGFVRSPWTGLYAILGFILIHQIEGMVLAPKVVGDAVGLHPLVVVLAILVGGELGGMGGMLLAVPAAGVARVLAQHLYRRLAQAGARPAGFRIRSD